MARMNRAVDSAAPKGNLAVIGGGPAGLRAAEVAASGGARVTLFEAKRSVGRKFLVAGRSGLNLTNAEPFDAFLEKYVGDSLPKNDWREMLSAFDNVAIREWAADLGVETFAASSGKVLPLPVEGRMKSTPLLRNWLARLRELGVVVRTGHRWIGFDESGALSFESEEGNVAFSFDAAVLALGGGSWPKSGSDGSWVSILAECGIRSSPLQASNCGWGANWPIEFLELAEGLPLKNLRVSAGSKARRGELVVTRYGLEGGPIYRLGPVLRSMPEPHVLLDFKPDLSHADVVQKLGGVKRNFVREAGRRLHLDPATLALLGKLPGRGPWKRTEQIATEIKLCRINLTKPRPIEEAISTAGGVCWSELDANLMLKEMPGVYVAGEMIDWDAPTGGYLLQACFATGTHAARAALGHLQ